MWVEPMDSSLSVATLSPNPVLGHFAAPACSAEVMRWLDMCNWAKAAYDAKTRLKLAATLGVQVLQILFCAQISSAMWADMQLPSLPFSCCSVTGAVLSLSGYWYCPFVTGFPPLATTIKSPDITPYFLWPPSHFACLPCAVLSCTPASSAPLFITIG